MFIKTETRAGKAYAKQMLLNFKASVAYINFLNFITDNCVHCEAVFVGYKLIFCWALPDSRCSYCGLIVEKERCFVNKTYFKRLTNLPK